MGLRAVGAATLVLLAVPASASGAVRCLGSPGGVCDTSHATLADAYSAAGNGDTIRLGAGEFVGSLFSTKRLTFDGAGPGLTRIRRPDGDGGPGLELRASSTVRDLRVQGSGAGAGLLLEANLGSPPASHSVSNVVAVPGATGAAGLGVSDFGSGDSVTAAITDTRAEPGLLASGPNVNVVLSRISAAPDDSDTPGVTLTNGAGGLLVDSRIETPAGTDAATKGVRVEGASELTLTRTLVSTDFTGLDVAANSRLDVFDSVVFVRQGGFDGNPVAGARVATPARLLVSGSSIASVHGDGDGAVWAQGSAAVADLRNTLVVNANTTGTGALSSTDGGRITAVNSAFRSRTVGPGGSVSAPGSATNFAGDPLITALSPTGLALRAGSPLIDGANPAFVAAGARDVTGAARSTELP